MTEAFPAGAILQILSKKPEGCMVEVRQGDIFSCSATIFSRTANSSRISPSDFEVHFFNRRRRVSKNLKIRVPLTAGATMGAKIKRYAEMYWTTGDLAEALRGYYGDDYEISDKSLERIMGLVEREVADAAVQSGNDTLLDAAIRKIEEKVK
jgi:hypothetical protein